MQGGRNIGKSWVQEGQSPVPCLYAPISATQCVTFDGTDAGLLLVNAMAAESGDGHRVQCFPEARLWQLYQPRALQRASVEQ